MVRLCNVIWRVLIAAMFLLAAYGKWREGLHYLPPFTIYDRLIGLSLVRHNAVLLVEAALALWLLSGWRIRWSATVAGVMLLGFIGLLTAELWAETPASCGCGISQVFPDGDPRMELIMGIIRNAVMLLGCLWLILMGDFKPGNLTTPPSEASTQEARRTKPE